MLLGGLRLSLGPVTAGTAAAAAEAGCDDRDDTAHDCDHVGIEASSDPHTNDGATVDQHHTPDESANHDHAHSQPGVHQCIANAGRDS